MVTEGELTQVHLPMVTRNMSARCDIRLTLPFVTDGMIQGTVTTLKGGAEGVHPCEIVMMIELSEEAERGLLVGGMGPLELEDKDVGITMVCCIYIKFLIG